MEDTIRKGFPIYQLFFSSIYIVFAIEMTSDKRHLNEFMDGHPIICSVFEKIIKILFKAFSRVVSLLLAIPQVISASDNEMRYIKEETR